MKKEMPNKLVDTVDTLKSTLELAKHQGKFNAQKHCGKIKLNKNPLAIQKLMRDEW
ncbi:MAG: hypothetical protein ACOYOA_15735 [Saprospiraceae bacterium]